MHCFKGMVIYYLKDIGSNHFVCMMHNISDDDVIEGKTMHAIYGCTDLKNIVTLSNHNIDDCLYVWHKYRTNRQLTAAFMSTLTEMVQSGMFMPVASWIIPHAGQGMEYKQTCALFKAITDPHNCTRNDVSNLHQKMTIL